jgi:DNA-binding SARP family transcriptional activator
MTTLRIYMLGPFRVLRSGEPIPPSAWRSQQTRKILKVLLTRRGRVVPADQLLEILWPKDAPTAARRRLHVRISQLRRALRAEPQDETLDPDGSSAYILTIEGGYAFDLEADCWLDTVEFEACAERGRRSQESGSLVEATAAYEVARALYRGDFLEEDLYEEWAFAERERLRERFLTVLTELAECYAQLGRYRRAIACCHEILAADPCRETAYVRLMLYHYYAGEQAQALRAYERCRQVLADELGVEPLLQTAALYEQVRQRQVQPVDSAVRYPEPVYEDRLVEVPYSLGRTPFVGRDREYARLANCVEETIAGHGRVAVVSGEAGLGKTRLVQEVLGYARQQGAVALEGQCFELGSALLYQPFVQALRSYLPTMDTRHLCQIPTVWLAEVARLLPELGEIFPDVLLSVPLPPSRQKSRLFEGVAQFIVCVSREQPLVIFLDDLHWADRPTLELLHYVARQAAGEKVLLVGAFRGEEVEEDHPLTRLLREMSKERALTRLELQPLSEKAVTELVAQMSHSSAGGLLFSRHIYRETEGNPFYVVAILQNLFEEGLLYVDENGEWATGYDASTVDYAELTIPPTMQEVIEARLARLDRASRQLLALASVVGQEFDPACLQMASGRSEEELFEVFSDLLRRRLIREESGGRGYEFDHSKVREVVYAELDGPQRVALHWRVGEALEKQHRANLEKVAERLVHHFQLAGQVSQTVKYAIVAGQEALRMCAHQEAGGFFQCALTAAEKADLSLTRAQRLAIQQGLGDAHWMAGRYGQARACYEESITHTQTATESDGLIFKIAYLDAQQGVSIPSLLLRAEDFQSKMADEQNPLAEARHWLQVGYAFLIQGAADQAREQYQRGWEIISNLATTSEEGRHAFDLAEAQRALGEARLAWGEYDQAANDLEEALPVCQGIGDLQGVMKCRLLLSEVRYRAGAWALALGELNQVVKMATRVEHPSLLADALFRRGYVYADQGAWDLAEAEGLRSRAIAEEVGDLASQSGAQFLLNRILIKRGEAEQALPSCRAMEAVTRALGSGLYLCLALRYLGEAYVGLGESEQALACCGEGLELAHEADFEREVGAIQRVWGEALAQQGEWDEAEARLQASLELLARIGSPYELGESHRSLGRLYWERGAVEAAKEHLDAALAVFEGLGAERDAAVTQHLLSDLADSPQ